MERGAVVGVKLRREYKQSETRKKVSLSQSRSRVSTEWTISCADSHVQNMYSEVYQEGEKREEELGTH